MLILCGNVGIIFRHIVRQIYILDPGEEIFRTDLISRSLSKNIFLRNLISRIVPFKHENAKKFHLKNVSL